MLPIGLAGWIGWSVITDYGPVQVLYRRDGDGWQFDGFQQPTMREFQYPEP